MADALEAQRGPVLAKAIELARPARVGLTGVARAARSPVAS